MPGLLKPLFANGPELITPHVFIRLLIAAAAGGLVAFIYRQSRLETELTPSFPKTLVLLAILIALVTQVIGDNTARAFSLVGALSIVRFRTVVRDTQDTAFVIFAVAVGMAIGAGYPWSALAGLAVVGGASVAMKSRGVKAAADTDATFLLSVRVGVGHNVPSLLGATLVEYLVEYRLLSMATARQGTSIDVSYETRLREDRSAEDLVRTLNRIEGVHDVEIKRRGLEEG